MHKRRMTENRMLLQLSKHEERGPNSMLTLDREASLKENRFAKPTHKGLKGYNCMNCGGKVLKIYHVKRDYEKISVCRYCLKNTRKHIKQYK